ncbi:MAG: hypothetical protein A3F70_03535 [Acidobacteria bacterium RIFCSPLOWO2_12_FULL_67_14]|nr:MAG: hypothetical protein A3H29_15760 [Acidobacteria bacterium RIFCSPLOWO2_02_FULL_67_21]OFW40070.1 MAG: hypothetical protein A3F70_03535 [Acidobacteria bacterium RIFCSPLOWO2_12_FULL_67_14]
MVHMPHAMAPSAKMAPNARTLMRVAIESKLAKLEIATISAGVVTAAQRSPPDSAETRSRCPTIHQRFAAFESMSLPNVSVPRARTMFRVAPDRMIGSRMIADATAAPISAEQADCTRFTDPQFQIATTTAGRTSTI